MYTSSGLETVIFNNISRTQVDEYFCDTLYYLCILLLTPPMSIVHLSRIDALCQIIQTQQNDLDQIVPSGTVSAVLKGVCALSLRVQISVSFVQVPSHSDAS